MSDILRPWLGRTVEQELGDVLKRWMSHEANNSQGAGQIEDLAFEDDGSNLRIRSPRPRVVQIAKFITHEDPLQVTLSDGATRVNATISKETARQYIEKHKKRITDGTPGGLFQLQNFEIVATHLGSRSRRITLFVIDLKPLGSNGSGLLGVPRAIEDRQELLEHMQRLKDYREQGVGGGARSRQQTPGRTLSSGSQSKSNSSGPLHEESQSTFATQVPATRVHPVITAKPRFVGKSAGLKSDTNRDFIPGQAQSKVPGLNNAESRFEGLAKHRTEIPQPSHNKRLPLGAKLQSTTNEELLSLLPPTKQIPSTKPVSNVAAPARLQPVSKIGSPASPVGNLQIESPTIAADISTSAADLQVESSSVTATAKIANEVQLNEPAVKGSDSEPGANHASARTQNRISSRDIKISKEQEALLNSKDSWLPAEPGRREPSANIPISLLQSLNHQADLRAKRLVSPNTKGKKVPEADENESSHGSTPLINHSVDQSASDSDVPVSSSEWPPTPQRDQLPPDSSMESADPRCTPNSQTRRSSNVSILSQVTHPRQPSPSHALRFRRNSSEASRSVRSPSRDSGPAVGAAQPCKGLRTGEARSGMSSPSLLESTLLKTDGIPPGEDDNRDVHKDLLGNNALQLDIKSSESSNVRDQEPQLSVSSIASALNQDSSASMESFAPRISQVKHHEKRSDLYSIPSSPVSDIEMTVPLPLQNQAATNGFPSTASQPLEPFTQVKRTPYVKGLKVEDFPLGSKGLPSTSESGSLANGTQLPEEDDHVSQSVPSVKELSSINVQSGQEEESTLTSNHSSLKQVANGERGATVDNTAREQSHDAQGASNSPERVNHPLEMDMPPFSSVTEVQRRYPEADTERHDCRLDGPEPKRKASDLEVLSPNVAKRRKRLKVPAAFNHVNDIDKRDGRLDPVEEAKRYRQNFLTSFEVRKATAPEESPIVPSTPTCNDASTEASYTDSETFDSDAGLSELTSSDQRAEVNWPVEPSSPKEYQPMDIDQDVDIRSPKLLPRDPTPSVSRDDLRSPGRNLVAQTLLQKDQSPYVIFDEAQAGAQTDNAIPPSVLGEDIVVPGGARMVEDQTTLPGGDVLDTRGEKSCPISQAAHVETSPTLRETNSRDKVPGPSSRQKGEEVEANKSAHECLADKIRDSLDRPIQTHHLAQPSQLGSLSLSSPYFSNSADITPRCSSTLIFGKAASPEILMSDLNAKSPMITKSTALEQSSRTPESQIIFEKFKAAYPLYPGDQKHFIAICKKIKILLSKDRMEHQALWDDFIVRHKIEYPQYVRQCTEDAEDPIPYEDFYRTEIGKPLCLEGLVTQRNLEEVLSLAGSKVAYSADQTEWKKPHTEIRTSRLPPGPTKPLANARKPSSPKVTIDLTGEEGPTDSRRPSQAISVLSKAVDANQTPTSRKRRSLPWAAHSNASDDGSLDSRGAHPLTLGLPLKTERGLRNFAADSTKIKDFHNSLIRGGLQDRRTEAESSTWDAQMQATWGHAQSVKDPVSARHASKNSPLTPLNQVQRSLQDNPRRHDRSIARKFSTQAFGSREQIETAAGSRDGSESSGWWHDESAPFKSFARAFEAIRPGNGNSYATPQAMAAIGTDDLCKKSKNKGMKIARRAKRIDPLKWEL